MGKTRFLRIDKFGKLYERAKQGDPGAIELTSNFGQSWRIPVDKTITGYINNIEIAEVAFKSIPTKLFRLSIKDAEGNIDAFSFPLFTKTGALDQYVSNLALVLEHINPTDTFSILPSTKMNPKGYLYKSFLFIKDGTYVKQVKEQTDKLPEPIIKEGIAGKKIYDFSDRDKALYDILLKNIERLSKPGGASAPIQQPIQQTVQVPPTVPPTETSEDDLPF